MTVQQHAAASRGALDEPVLKEVTLYIGGLHASSEPTLIRTLLGSCISVCLYDPVRRVGGMNHFMLPHATAAGDGGDALRFGVHAMDTLIGAMMKLGGDRRRFVAKAFGGAHVLNIESSSCTVPQQNIAFIRRFLKEEGITTAAEDLGGFHPRHIRFFTASGRAFIKNVTTARLEARVVRDERRRGGASATPGDVTLFE